MVDFLIFTMKVDAYLKNHKMWDIKREEGESYKLEFKCMTGTERCDQKIEVMYISLREILWFVYFWHGLVLENRLWNSPKTLNDLPNLLFNFYIYESSSSPRWAFMYMKEMEIMDRN